MRFLSFRNRSVVKRIAIVLLILVIILAIVAVATFFYLQRFLVYGKDGVYLDFSRPPITVPDEPERLPEADYPTTEIVQPEPEEEKPTVSETVLSGFVVPHAMLQKPLELLETCRAMEAPCTLLFDLKDSVGNFFYDSAVADQGGDSRDLISAVLTELKDAGFHLIARVSALRDRSYGLANPPCGLPLASGALWMDAGGCYWLDPADDEVQVRLIRICTELFDLGFSEVVLNNFYFPDAEQIVYTSDKSRDELIASALERIRSALEGKGLLSIQLHPDQAIPDPGTGRLYSATDSAQTVQPLRDAVESSLIDPGAQLVFLTDSRDTRFNGYGLLRSWEE